MVITLVYLSYVPYGVGKLDSFLLSYNNKLPGINHEFYILFNGHECESQLLPFFTSLSRANITFKYLISPEKFDIDSYFYFARNVKSDYYCFLNTHSIIVSDQWLLKLLTPFHNDKNVGVAGATGGYGNAKHDEEYRSILSDFRSLTFIKFKKALLYRFNYYPKVLPHVRTNAFMIKSDIFMKLKYYNIRPSIINLIKNFSNTKHKSLSFEHGNRSMTIQVLKLGLKPVIVGDNGLVYEINSWIFSKTFWLEDQSNLLVKDNQTLKYESANTEEKKNMQYSAWKI